MKKRCAVVVSALLAAGMLFAMGGKESGSTNKSSSDELTIAIWDKNQEPGLTKIVQDFTAKTGIKARIQVTPWEQYWTMLEAGATGGSLPDVFWMHPGQFATYAQYNMLLDLSAQIKASKTVDMSKFPKDIVKLYNAGGKQFAMPKDVDTIALWYNKTLFDKAGVKYPDASWTWDTFREAAKKLTAADGSQYGYTLRPSQYQIGWYNMVYDMGGEIISADMKKSGFDKPGTISAIAFMESMIKDGSLPPYEVITENKEEALFKAGKVAMVTMGSWLVAELCNDDYVKANCDLTVLPKDAKTGKRVSIYNGLGWAAAANTKNPAGAWALIEYLGSKEAQVRQSDLGVAISAYSGTANNWVSAHPKFNLKAHLDMLGDIVLNPHSKRAAAWENMAVEKLIDVWTGKRSASAVCPEIAVEMNKMLAEE